MAMPTRPRSETSYRPSIFPGFQLTSAEEDAGDAWEISRREARLFCESNSNITLEYLLSLVVIQNADNESISARTAASNAVVEKINDRKALLLRETQYEADTRIIVDHNDVSLQNACASMALTLQYSSVTRMILDNALPKSLGGGQYIGDDKSFTGNGSRIPKHLIDIINDSGAFWLPPIEVGGCYEEFLDINSIMSSINRKTTQDSAVLNIMHYYLSSIRGVGYLCEILKSKIDYSGNVDSNLDRHFILQINQMQSIKKHCHRSQLKKSTEFCRKVMMHMQFV